MFSILNEKNGLETRNEHPVHNDLDGNQYIVRRKQVIVVYDLKSSSLRLKAAFQLRVFRTYVHARNSFNSSM